MEGSYIQVFMKQSPLFFLFPIFFIACSNSPEAKLPSYKYTTVDSAESYFGKWVSFQDLDSASVMLIDTLDSTTFINAYQELARIISSNGLVWNTIYLNDSVVSVSNWKETDIRNWLLERVVTDSSIIKSTWIIPSQLRLSFSMGQTNIIVRFRTNPIEEYHIWSDPKEYMQYSVAINGPPKVIGSRLQYSFISSLIEWGNKQLLDFDKVEMRLDCDNSDSYKLGGKTLGGKAIFLDMEGGKTGEPDDWDKVAQKWASHYNLSWDTTHYPSGGFKALAEPRVLLSMNYPTVVIRSQNGTDRSFSFHKSEKGLYGFGRYWSYLCRE